MNKVLEERDRQNKCEIAKSLVAQGVSVKTITNALKITEEELQQMLKESE